MNKGKAIISIKGKTVREKPVKPVPTPLRPPEPTGCFEDNERVQTSIRMRRKAYHALKELTARSKIEINRRLSESDIIEAGLAALSKVDRTKFLHYCLYGLDYEGKK